MSQSKKKIASFYAMLNVHRKNKNVEYAYCVYKWYAKRKGKKDTTMKMMWKKIKETLRKNLFCSSLCRNSLNVMAISHKCF